MLRFQQMALEPWCFSTVCVTDLDQGSEMIIFESILTMFKAGVVFRGHWSSSKID
jgi:hypothetical protein